MIGRFMAVRSSFSDRCADKTAFPGGVVEMAPVHTGGSADVRAYILTDQCGKRRELAEGWARCCDGAEVVSLAEVRSASLSG
jgi:hypothetical protein